MAKFKVRQDADYLVGYLRYGHREGVIEANSVEDVINKLQNDGCIDYLGLVVDDYEVEDVSYGSNPFKIEPVMEEWM